jgi:hypothetical protein
VRITLLKIILFFAAFIFVQGATLPWIISNNILPLWADIILVSGLLFGWVVLIDRIANKYIKRSDKNGNDTTGEV